MIQQSDRRMMTKRLRTSHLLLAFATVLAGASLIACVPSATGGAIPAATASPTAVFTSTPIIPVATLTATPSATGPRLPDFKHIVIVVFENKEFGVVYGAPQMTYFNKLVKSNTLLTQYYAVTHPSLPNYLAMIGGDTYNITFDCTSCPVNAQSLPDQIEASGRSWKTYQEDMPSPCYIQAGAGKTYAMKHNPFIYFLPIRLNAERCNGGIVPFTALSTDLAARVLPNFAFITPNLCNDPHHSTLNLTHSSPD